MPTADALPTQRLHIVTGKGGTGKTTVAAALALALANHGRRVLLVEVEGRQGLAQLFDLPPLPPTETRLTATRGGEVIGLAIDTEVAMLEYLELFYNIKRGGSILRKMGAIDFVTTIAPGLRDVLLTGKIKEAVTRQIKGKPAFDFVVVDAPPTGRITHFLQITLEVAGLAKMGPIHKQSLGVIDLLHSRQTAVHIVTLLEEMPVQESLDAAAELRAAGYRLGQVIVNRARPELVAASAKPTAAKLADGLKQAGLDAQLAAGLLSELTDYAERQAVQEHAAEALQAIDVPIRRLPELAPPVDLGSLYELAEALELEQW